MLFQNLFFYFALSLNMTMELKQVYRLFPTGTDAISFLERLIWDGKVYCPYCKSYDNTSIKETKRHHCNTCNTSFSVTVKTVFHRTKVDLQKWIYLISIMSTGRKIPSLRNLADELQVTKDTISKMINRIKQHYTSDKEFIDKILNSISHVK